MMSTNHEYALSSVMYTLEKLALKPLQADPTEHGKYHDAIPYPIPQFLTAEKVARTILGSPKTFIDVGSGTGVKLAIMEQLGWKVYGIERVKEYAEMARLLCPNAVWIENADIFDLIVPWEFYDYIFMYRPIQGEEEMKRLVNKITFEAKVGAILFFPLCPEPTQLFKLSKIDNLENAYRKERNEQHN